MKFGTNTYRAGARERLDESRLLMDHGYEASSIYLAGLAVEGMLRSLLWLRDKRFDERHDLRRIAVQIENLGLVRSGQRDQDFVKQVEGVVRLWANDLRFADTEQLSRWLHRIGTIKSKEGLPATGVRKALEPVFRSSQEMRDAMATQTTREEVEGVLKVAFGDKTECHLEVLSNGKVSGNIVSKAFAEKQDTERQRSIWDALTDKFGQDATAKVGTLLAYTPDEWNVALD